jgi:hypothetical protein
MPAILASVAFYVAEMATGLRDSRGVEYPPPVFTMSQPVRQNRAEM